MKPKVWIFIIVFVCFGIIAALYYFKGPRVIIRIREEGVPVEPILDAFYSHKSPEEFLKIIRENPSVVNETFMETSWRNTPLKYAAISKNKDLVKLFIIEGANVDDALNYFKQSESPRCQETYILIQNTIEEIEAEKSTKQNSDRH